MATFNNGAVLAVTGVGRWNDQVEMRNVYQMKLLAGAPLSEAQVLDDLGDWIQLVINVLKAIQTTLLIWRGFSVADLNGVYTSGFVPFTSAIAGTATGDPLPPGVSMLQFMPTGEANRQLRKYIPGGTEAQITTAGIFGTSTTAIAATTAPYMLVDVIVNAHTWQYGHAKPNDGASWVRPVVMNVSTNPSYQRRRRLGRGV